MKNPSELTTFGQLVVRAFEATKNREEKGERGKRLTWKEFARRVGVSEQAVKRWRQTPDELAESGFRPRPSEASRKALARVAGIPLSEVESSVDATYGPLSSGEEDADVVVRSIAEQHGLDPTTTQAIVTRALEVIARELSTRTLPAQHILHQPVTGVREVVSPSTKLRHEQVDSGVLDDLTPEQRAGLALLCHGRHVEGWRILAALEMLQLPARTQR